jgi:hypothetical protein
MTLLETQVVGPPARTVTTDTAFAERRDFVVTFSVDGPPFTDEGFDGDPNPTAVASALRWLAEKIENGYTEGYVQPFGTPVGHFGYTFDLRSTRDNY